MAVAPQHRHLGAVQSFIGNLQTAEDAAILLWSTVNWTIAASLPAHTLTVTQLEFSPDGARLLSVSRDRSVAMFERCHTEGERSGTNQLPLYLRL